MNSAQLGEHLSKLMPRKLWHWDAGARWGLSPQWAPFRPHLQVVAFEPDEEEYRALA